MRGVALGLVAAMLLYAIITAGIVTGLLGVLTLVLVMCAVPVSPHLAPRLAVAGALFLGWTPITWYWALPGSLNHGALLVAGAVGGLVCWTSVGADVGGRLRALRPSVGLADLLPLCAGAGSALAMFRWLSAGTPEGALALMLPGFDNAPHVSMFVQLRTHGAMMLTTNTPTPDGSPWYFSNYPAGFHAVAATISDLLSSRVGAPSSQAVAYVHSTGVVVIVSVLALTAGLCSVPVLRQRPVALVPATALLAGVFLVGPGGTALADGFAPFWFAAASVGLGLLLFAVVPAQSMVSRLAVVGACCVAVANSWVPLMLLLLPVVEAVLVSSVRGCRVLLGDRRRTVGCVLIVLFAAIGVALPVTTLVTTVSPHIVTDALGGFDPPAPFPLLALLAVTALCMRYARNVRLPFLQPGVEQSSWRPLTAVPLLGALAALALVAALVASRRSPGYYFFKYLTGFELVLAVLLSLAGATVLASLPRRRTSLICWCLAPLVLFGATWLQPQSGSGLTALTSAKRPGTSDLASGTERAFLAHAISQAVDGSTSPATSVLVAAPTSSQHAFLAQSWFMGLTGTWTQHRDALARPLTNAIASPADALAPAEEILRVDPQAIVLVPPPVLDETRAVVGATSPWVHRIRSSEGPIREVPDGLSDSSLP